MKKNGEITCIVGGQQGEGIESVGEILAKAMSRIGFYLFGSRNFSSRIKGGHTDYNLRISQEEVFSPAEMTHIIIAFDEDTIKLHQRSLVDGGVILYDPKTVKRENLQMDPHQASHCHEFPFSQLAKELGSEQMKNIVAVGAACALLDQPMNIFEKAIAEQFEKKGEEIVSKNLQAVHKGFDYLSELHDHRFPLDHAKEGQRMFMSGSESIALGAVVGGCRFMAGYPITPASEILENLIRLLPEYGGVVVQSEDELAAVAMVIGAGYSGVRAMTSTAGPGISLMQEAIGLSGATEIPIVIVDCQRGGPSSGMATKFEQSDLNAMIGGTHGEAPRIVLSPSTVQEALMDMPRAFNLAEEFQCPVFIATDLILSTCKQTVEMFDFNDIVINRGKIASEEELVASGEQVYKRFAVTADGITPRSIPGQRKGMHHVTGIEHGDTGHPSENPNNRMAQMTKRLKKLDLVPHEEAIKFEGSQNPELLLVGFGATYGVIRETRLVLESMGIEVGHAHLRMVHPLPKTELSTYTNAAVKVIVIEQNATGQLANLINQQLGINTKLHRCLKFNGVPFSCSDILSFYKELG